jgi:hypothetical protein
MPHFLDYNSHLLVQHNFEVVRSAGQTTYNFDNPPRRDVVSTGTTGDNVVSTHPMHDDRHEAHVLIDHSILYRQRWPLVLALPH